MQVLNILSAGAAQAVVSELAATFHDEGSHRVRADFGAVQTIKARVLSGEPADVVILTDRLIDELIERGAVVAGSRVDLGAVDTGVAVRADTPVPALGDMEGLRAAMLSASRIVCPDPEVATAGRVLLQALTRLGIMELVRPRVAYCPSGYAAVALLMQGSAERELGVMQVTEILAHQAIALAGILPQEVHDGAAVYSIGLATRSMHPELSARFIRRLSGERDRLQAAGFTTTAPGH